VLVCSTSGFDDPGALKLSGDPDHPFTRGLLCRKIHRHPARLASHERIRSPMLREGGRGGRFRPATWDEAMDVATAALAEARSWDPASILMIRSAGSMGAGKEFAEYVFGLLGARGVSGSLCDAAGTAAIRLDAGSLDMNDPGQIDESDAVVLWGKNPRASSVHTAAQVIEARRRGGIVIAVTPDALGMTGLADHVVRVRPGGDRFLALAVARMLVEYGPGGLARSSNEEAFRALLVSYDTDELLAICDVSEADARRLAEVYVSSPRVATIVGWGTQRYLHGGETVRALHALALLAGTLGVEGGGFFYNRSSSEHFRPISALLAERGLGRELLPPPLEISVLADSMRAASPPVRVAWLFAANLLNQGPDSTALRRAFDDVETVVAVEAFWTDTARAATIVLPPALWLEDEDVIGSCWQNEVAAVRAIVDPPAGCRSDFDILLDLAVRLRLPVPYGDLDKWLRARLPADGPTLETLRERGYQGIDRPPVAWQDGFTHGDGRFRLVDAVTPPSPPDADYPFTLLTQIRGEAMHSQMSAAEQTGPLKVRMHPDASAALGLDDGVRVRVVSRVGHIEGTLSLDSGLHPEAVACPRGGWIEFGLGVNQATVAQTTDMGGGTAFYSTRVRVERVEAA